jgi:hypothetical protein
MRSGEDKGKGGFDLVSPSLKKRKEEAQTRTRLIHTLRHQVIHQHSDKPVRPTQCQLFLPDRAPPSVDPRQNTLCCRFFVARSTVDLTCEEETGDAPGFEGVCFVDERVVQKERNVRFSSRGSMWSYSTP